MITYWAVIHRNDKVEMELFDPENSDYNNKIMYDIIHIGGRLSAINTYYEHKKQNKNAKLHAS